jgi:hypothetical protein
VYGLSQAGPNAVRQCAIEIKRKLHQL